MRPSYKTFSLFFSILFTFFVLFFQSIEHVNAQLPPGLQNTQTINLTLTPDYPKANQNVQFFIESYTTNLDRADISWYVDGKLMKNAVGAKTFLFTTGNIGTANTIKVIVKTVEKTTLQKTITLRPADIDLVWQADSYVPAFYKGKALYAYQSAIKIIALPSFITKNGSSISPDNILYTWRKDGEVLGNLSGYGKNVLSLPSSIILKPLEIAVDAVSATGDIQAHGSIEVRAVPPQIVLYENSPLYGRLLENAILHNFSLKNDEVKISAIPYFFGTKNKSSSDLAYSWSLNGAPIAPTGDTSELTFRRESGLGGMSALSLEIKNIKKIFQFTNTNTSLSFEQKAETVEVSF